MAYKLAVVQVPSLCLHNPSARSCLQGDLALLAKDGNAGMPRGHVVAYKANHALHIKFLKELSKIMT